MIKSDGIVQQGNGVSIVQRISKYLGKKVWVGTEFGPGYTGILNEVFYRDLEIQVIAEDETEHRFFGTEISSYIYPILKTVENLTEEEIESILINYHDMNGKAKFNDNFSFIFKGCTTGDYNPFANLPCHSIFKLLSINAGATHYKDSPTGYVSIHDGLPCKRWSEVFK